MDGSSIRPLRVFLHRRDQEARRLERVVGMGRERSESIVRGGYVSVFTVNGRDQTVVGVEMVVGVKRVVRVEMVVVVEYAIVLGSEMVGGGRDGGWG